MARSWLASCLSRQSWSSPAPVRRARCPKPVHGTVGGVYSSV